MIHGAPYVGWRPNAISRPWQVPWETTDTETGFKDPIMAGTLRAPSRTQFLTAVAMVEQGYPLLRAHNVAVARVRQERSAEKMRKRANRINTMEQIRVGSIVHFKTSPFDRAKTDPTYATAIVVKQKGRDAYIIANEAGKRKTATTHPN